MITRRAFACLRQHKTYTRAARPCKNVSFKRRLASTFSAPPVSTPPPSIASPLAVITSELDKLSPRFDVQADSIQIIRGPVEFFETLKTKIASAKRRIYLSTLYVGKAEHELITALRDALRKNPELKVSIMTDALRGTREAPDPSCASLLASLISDFGPQRVEVRMFHTPNLNGVRKAILPKRINEGWGLLHMKLYGIDDEIIMSGANLSTDYFTDRQDRYHVLKSKDITDYFYKIYQTTCQLSYQVVPSVSLKSGFELQWPDTNLQPSPVSGPNEYIAQATKAFAPLLESVHSSSNPEKATDTQVYPLLQLTPLLKPDTSTELPALTGILAKLGTEPSLAGSKWTFTAGYFNMTPDVRELLLKSNPTSAVVIAASPWANGFYGSKGVSGMLPAAYTYLARRFLDTARRAGMGDQIAVKEWRRGTVGTPGGWTYHAKGIWITLPGDANPSISLVGSSNYTTRSYSLDLEANTLIVTQNKDLQRRLGEEEKWLQDYATTMSRDDYAKTERRVGLHVRIAMWIVTLVGGAL